MVCTLYFQNRKNIDNTTFTNDKVITIPEKPINTKYEPTNTCPLIIY